jgi:hypothetical protein
MKVHTSHLTHPSQVSHVTTSTTDLVCIHMYIGPRACARGGLGTRNPSIEEH